MKKKTVFIHLFIIPIITYIFFALGVYSFVKTPTFTENIYSLNKIIIIDNKIVSTLDKITVLIFLGSNAESVKTAIFNLIEKIEKRFGGLMIFN